jgi:hypothetical protein
MERRAELVALGGRIWCAPDGVFHLRCVARNSKRSRCGNPIEYGQTGTWPEFWATRGVIIAYNLETLNDAACRRWLAQHCQVHDGPDVVDIQAPEWEPFDPDGAHAAMVTPVADVIAAATRSLSEGITDRWTPRWPTPPRLRVIGNAG